MSNKWKAIGLYDDATAEVGQTIRVKSVDENSLPTEWEAMDAPVVEGAVLESDLFDTGMTDTVTWDGNTEGIESFNDFLFKICDISDENATEIANGSADLVVTAIDESGNSYTMGCVGGQDDGSVWMATDNTSYGVYVAGSVMAPEFGLPSSGIWINMSDGSFLSSITFEGINLVETKVIKEELILGGAITNETWIFELEDGGSVSKQVLVI